MTTFGGDVSSRPASLASYKSAGGQFLIARCVTEPCTVDPNYAPTVADAEAAGILAGGYDFLTGDFAGHTVEQRAELFISALGPATNRIAMLDVERPSYPTLHPSPQPSDVARWMTVWRAHYPSHPVLLYLPRWYWSTWTTRPDLHTVGPLVASNYTTGWTSFAAYTAAHGDTNAVWTTGYAGYSGPSLWQYAGSVSTYGFGADLTAFRGTMSDLRTLALGGDTMAGLTVRLIATATTTSPWTSFGTAVVNGTGKGGKHVADATMVPFSANQNLGVVQKATLVEANASWTANSPIYVTNVDGQETAIWAPDVTFTPMAPPVPPPTPPDPAVLNAEFNKGVDAATAAINTTNTNVNTAAAATVKK